jgi:hypothetical protein
MQEFNLNFMYNNGDKRNSSNISNIIGHTNLKPALAYITPDLLNLLYGAGNFGKIWSANRQHEIK